MTSEPVDPLTEHERWTAAADKYQGLIGKCTMHGTKRLVEIVNELSPFTNSSNALDVGAGAGSLTLCVHKANPDSKILATDIAEGMLAQIDKHGISNITTQREDAVTLSGLTDNSFSHGLSSFAINFVPDPEAALHSLFRVVKPGGTIGVAIWGPTTSISDVHDEACRRINPSYKPKLPETKGSWRSEADHHRMLEKAGFKNVGTELVKMPFEPGSAKGACDYWFRSTNPVPRALVGHWIENGGSAEDLEREYEKIVREDYEDGKALFMDGTLGWGIKP